MMGCMAQSKKEELFKELPRLDLVVGTQNYHRVFEHVDGLLRARQERRMDELQTAFSGTHVCDVCLLYTSFFSSSLKVPSSYLLSI